MKNIVFAVIMATAWLVLSFFSKHPMLDIAVSQLWCAASLMMIEMNKRNERTND